MNVRTAERRRSVRMPANHFAIIRDHRNRHELGRGRTADINESGVLVMVHSSERIPESGNVCVSLTLPADPAVGTKRHVIYTCRIVHRKEMGNMIGLGLEFLTKLA
jgi:hypothetical protein